MEFNPVYRLSPYAVIDGPNKGYIQRLQCAENIDKVDTAGCCTEVRIGTFVERFSRHRTGKFPFRKWTERRAPITHRIQYIAVHVGGGHTEGYVLKRLEAEPAP